MLRKLKDSPYVRLILGGMILSFGLYNVHSFANVTEGGVLGATLLLQEWFKLSPAISNFVLNLFCYLLGFKMLGKRFVWYSLISSCATSVFFALFEQFPPLWPSIADHQLLAAILGAFFVGIGVGLAVSAEGAPGGDDALALAFNKLSGIKIQWIYLFNDLVILVLSLTYIPINDIIYSLLTVILSGQIIGFISNRRVEDIELQ